MRSWRKQKFFIKLADSFDVACAQETHGSCELAKHLHDLLSRTHRIFWSFHGQRGVGGICIIVKNSFASHFQGMILEELCPGRCANLRCVGDQGNAQFTFLHLDPGLHLDRKVALLENIRDSVSCREGFRTFIAGDFNFEAAGEGNMNMFTGEEIARHAALVNSWDLLFPEFVELFQGSYTRVGASAAGRIVSRIDRIDCNLDSFEIGDLDISAGVWGNIGKTHGRLSDHVPVHASVSSKRAPLGIPTIPAWVAKHPFFPRACERLQAQLGPLPGNSHEALSCVKAVMRSAASMVRNVAKIRGARTAEERIHWAITAVRAARRSCHGQLHEALGAHPAIAQFFDAERGAILDLNGVLASVRSDVELYVEQQLRLMRLLKLMSMRKPGKLAHSTLGLDGGRQLA